MATLAQLLDAIENKRWPASLPEPEVTSEGAPDLEAALAKSPVKKESVISITDTPLVEGEKERIMMMTDDSGKKVLSPKTDLGEMVRGNYNQQLNKIESSESQAEKDLAESMAREQSSRDTLMHGAKARLGLINSPFPQMERTDIGISQRLADIDKRRAAAESAPQEGEDLASKLIYAFGPGLLGLATGGTAGYKAAGETHKEASALQKEARDRASKKKERTADTAYKEMLSLGKLAEGTAQMDKQNFDSRVKEIELKNTMLDQTLKNIENVNGKDSAKYKEAQEAVNKLKGIDADIFKSGIGEIKDVELGQMKIESDEKRTGMAAQAKKVAQVKSQNKDTMALRKEYNSRPIVKQFNEVDASMRKMSQLGDTPAGDLSMIFAYMKMLDENSVVREGEQTLAIRTASIPDRIWNAYEQLKTGQKLNPTQRKQFREEAYGLYSAKKSQLSEVQDEFSHIANNQGIDSSLIFQKPREISRQEATRQQPSAQDKAVLDLVTKNPNDKSPKMERAREVLRKKGLLK